MTYKFISIEMFRESRSVSIVSNLYKKANCCDFRFQVGLHFFNKTLHLRI